MDELDPFPPQKSAPWPRCGRLVWTLWCLSLAACPIAMWVIGSAYGRTRPEYDIFEPRRDWTTPTLETLLAVHLIVSVAAVIAIRWLPGGPLRWLACLAVVFLVPIAWVIGALALMSTTGIWL